MGKKPNIIFLLEDQQQAQAIEPDHFCKTPNIEMLMQDCVVFNRAHTCNAVCSPSRASLMTGVLPHNHGMIDCTHTVPAYRAEYDAKLDTLSRVLKREGYAMAYYGKWHIERTNKLENYGFDEYETETMIPKFHHTPIDQVTIHTEGYVDKIIAGVFAEDETATEEYYIYNRAMDFMRRQENQKEPWCAFISTYAPHDPYSVPKEIYDSYRKEEILLPESFLDTMEDKPAVYRRLQSVWKDLGADEVKKILRCYYSYCTLVDRQIGRLISYLKESDQYENTLIVYLADHGDLMGAHGLFCKGVPAFEEIYHIPLFMKLPGGQYRGKEMNQLAGTCDIAPTVLELAGLSGLLGKIDGHSLAPWISGLRNDSRMAYAEFQGQRYAYTQRIIWMDNYKYVFNTFDYDEFYDLASDPYEKKNEINNLKYQEVIKTMAGKMWEIIKETGDSTMMDAQYYMLRIAPLGPGESRRGSGYSTYNKEF